MTSPTTLGPTIFRCRGATVWLAILAATGLVARADASVLCGRRSAATGAIAEGATLKLRSACRDGELAVDPGDLGMQVLPAVVVRTGNAVSTAGTVSTPANCEPGEVAAGGGVLSTGSNGGVPVMRSSRPQPEDPGATPTGWRSTVANGADTGTITATAYVVCASAQ